MNIQRKNSAHHFRMQSEREQTLVSWILDVYTLVHNYLVLGYKNENNSGYAWKLPGVNTTSEPIPGNEGNIITNAR